MGRPWSHLREVAEAESGEYLPPPPRHATPTQTQSGSAARIRENQAALQSKAAWYKKRAKGTLFWGLLLCAVSGFTGPAVVALLPLGIVLLLFAAASAFEAARFRSLGRIGPEDLN